MPATIKDIARRLNISTSTVSYALNGGPRSVGGDLRQRVLQAAQELDYQPNRVARSLVTGTANAIGVVPPSIERDVFTSPFVRTTWNSLVNEAEVLGQDILLFAGHNRNRPDESGAALMDGRIHGVVFIAPLQDSGAIGFLAERGFPFVSVSSQPAGPGLHFNADNRRGVVDALEHLVALGHRRIAHITGWPGSPDGRIREDVFRRFCTEKGWIVPADYIQEGIFTVSSGYEAATRLLSLNPRPTAIFAANDEMAYGVCQAARDLGFHVPEDLSVIGFDDSDLCTIHTPQLSTVRQPVDEMATAALRAVVALASGQTGLASTTFKTQLVIRASTALAPKEART